MKHPGPEYTNDFAEKNLFSPGLTNKKTPQCASSFVEQNFSRRSLQESSDISSHSRHKIKVCSNS